MKCTGDIPQKRIWTTWLILRRCDQVRLNYWSQVPSLRQGPLLDNTTQIPLCEIASLDMLTLWQKKNCRHSAYLSIALPESMQCADSNIVKRASSILSLETTLSPESLKHGQGLSGSSLTEACRHAWIYIDAQGNGRYLGRYEQQRTDNNIRNKVRKCLA